jgi:hypothetical protein
MRTHSRRETAPFGELVTVAFDTAAQYSKDPDEVARLATSAVMDLLRRSLRAPSLEPRSRVRPPGGARR